MEVLFFLHTNDTTADEELSTSYCFLMELLSAGSLHVHKAQIHFLTNCVCTLAVVVALFYSVCLCTISHLPFSFFFFIRDVSAMAAATSPAGKHLETHSNILMGFWKEKG